MEVVTVDYLLDLFQRLHDAGKGNMKIKCKDNFLHKDEIVITYYKNEIEFRVLLYNLPITQRVKDFCEDVDKAMRKFYESKEYQEIYQEMEE